VAGRIDYETSNGLIAFAADASGGDALTDPVEFGMVEIHPERMDIYVTQQGEPTRWLIATDAHERCPAFSPDGRYLAYVELGQRVRSVAPSIVVVRVNVSGVLSAPELRVSLPADAVYERKLSIGPPCPQWSPDGSQIAYLALPQRELRVSTLDGQERVLDSITPSFVDGPFAWSPDGDAIAYTTTDGVWVGSLDGSAPTLVWRTDGRPVSVSWSPRGELAVTVLTEVAESGGTRDVRTVHVVDVDTGSERSLDTIHVYDYGAAWSPDGSRLAFVDEKGDVRLSDRNDSSMTTLSPRYEDGRQMHFWDVTWSPDGERLLAMARSDSPSPSNSTDSERGFALVSLSTDGASADALTPWTWAMDWINLQEVSWQPLTN
jgi:Tol biopolymer transport system component